MAGDFNNDGMLDLAVGPDYSGGISVLLGNGDGTFQYPKHYSASSRPYAIDAMTAGDFTGDGTLDLAIVVTYLDVYAGTDVLVALGNGSGTFEPATAYQLEQYIYSNSSSIVVGDFTGNGHIDLAVADNTSGYVTVLLGNGNSTFQPPVSYWVGLDASSLAAGDLNGGGFLDLAVADSESDDVSVLLSDGDGVLAGSGPIRNDATGDSFAR